MTGFVTAVKTAYWNHTPLVLVTASGAPGTVSISVQGEPGTLVEVWGDGTASRFTLTLDASGRADAIYGQG